MKSSLAFAGALLVAFATGALLDNAIKTRDGTSLSHPGLFAPESHIDENHRRDFAPDAASLRNTTGVFAPNLGQASHDVYFQFIGEDLIAHFLARSIVLLPRTRHVDHASAKDHVAVRFIGANRRPGVEASIQSSLRLQYAIGKAKSYTANVPLFSELTYEGLYDGVDLRIEATSAGVLRAFTFSAGVSPSQLLMHFERAGQPNLSASRSLEIPTPSMNLSYGHPIAYQIADGTRTPVDVDFEIRRYGAVGFKVADFDPAIPLVVEVEGI